MTLKNPVTPPPWGGPMCLNRGWPHEAGENRQSRSLDAGNRHGVCAAQVPVRLERGERDVREWYLAVQAAPWAALLALPQRPAGDEVAGDEVDVLPLQGEHPSSSPARAQRSRQRREAGWDPWLPPCAAAWEAIEARTASRARCRRPIAVRHPLARTRGMVWRARIGIKAPPRAGGTGAPLLTRWRMLPAGATTARARPATEPACPPCR